MTSLPSAPLGLTYTSSHEAVRVELSGDLDHLHGPPPKETGRPLHPPRARGNGPPGGIERAGPRHNPRPAGPPPPTHLPPPPPCAPPPRLLAARPGLRDLRLDCAGLSAVDSSGLAALLMVRRLADKAGAGLHIDGRTVQLNRILEITGTLDHLTAPGAGTQQLRRTGGSTARGGPGEENLPSTPSGGPEPRI
ncbi:STAS domain-containing protein [Streptomyces erythrochromogenes]|uniref:STAS domain-containing protein n=1 Tax=Streptomyces erythrochromogenes TaxID=285574 RepID=UPI0036B60791